MEISEQKNKKKVKDLTEQKKDLEEKLKTEINNFTKYKKLSASDKMLKIYEELNAKDKQLKELQSKIPVDLTENNAKLMSIIIYSPEHLIHCCLICKSTEYFKIIETRFYEKYPDKKDDDAYYLAKGIRVNGNKTLEENNIQDGDIILYHLIDNDE